jgi:hypothetical protein
MKTKALVSLIGFFGQQWLGGLAEAKNWTDAWFIEGSILYLQYDLIDKASLSAFWQVRKFTLLNYLLD